MRRLSEEKKAIWLSLDQVEREFREKEARMILKQQQR